MSRPGSLDRADTESHDDYPDRPMPDGVYMSGGQQDPPASPYGLWGLRKWRTKIKIDRKMWRARTHPPGWECRGCGFFAVSDDCQILHQAEHDQRRFDADELASLRLAVDDLKAQVRELEGNLHAEQDRNDVLLIATGHADDAALIRVVERIMAVARDHEPGR